MPKRVDSRQQPAPESEIPQTEEQREGDVATGKPVTSVAEALAKAFHVKQKRREAARKKRAREQLVREKLRKSKGKRRHTGVNQKTADGKPKTGRPKFELPDERKEEIRMQYGVGLSHEQVRLLGDFPQTTFERNIDAFNELQRQGLAFCEGDILLSIYSQGKGGNMKAAELYLERVSKWTRVTRSEVSGIGGSPIQTENLSQKTETLTAEKVHDKLEHILDRLDSVVARRDTPAPTPQQKEEKKKK